MDVSWGFSFDILLMLWVAGGILGLSAAKSFYSHYFIQVLPALCVATAWVWMQSGSIKGLRTPVKAAALAGLILLVPALSGAVAIVNIVKPVISRQGAGLTLHPDSTTLIAGDILKASGGVASDVYVFDYEPIIYALAKASLPTRYAYPAFLTTCSLERVAQVNAPVEVARVLAGHPDFIVVSADPIAKLPVDPQAYARLRIVMAAQYTEWRQYDDALVYRFHRGPNASLPERLPKSGC